MRNVVLTIVVLFLTVSAYAIEPIKWFNGETLYWENDSFGIGRKSDRFYTQGAKVSFLISPKNNPDWLKVRNGAFHLREAFCKHFCDSNKQWKESVSFVFGQNFYTPENILKAEPQPDDHPWAGYLYTGFAESIVDENTQRDLHYLEGQVGVLGPAAGAHATQYTIHIRFGFSDKDPQGWPNQFKNEPAFNFLYLRAHRFGNDTLDFVPQAGGTLGTIQTSLIAGATTRLGWHISGFPVSTIRFAVTPNENNLPHKVEAYVFAGAEERWVPFNAVLDGGFFRNGPKANGPKRFVDDLKVGAAFRIRALRLTYTVVDRGKEFETPPGHVARQRFGSWALTVEPFNSFRAGHWWQ